MMPQMESGEPIRGQSGAGYRGYEGQQSSSQPPYGTSYQPPPSSGAYDDNFVEALAQRIVYVLNQKSSEKVHTQARNNERPSAGQRLALAIVSIVLIVPIAGVLFSTLGFVGLIGFAIACGAILLINVVFNVTGR